MKKFTNGLWFFAMIGVIMVSFGPSAYGATNKLEKAIKSYEKKIEKAEQKSCNTDLKKPVSTISKSCAKAVKSLDKVFDKYSDEIKSDAQIISLRERHEKMRGMIAGLEHQAAIEKAARNYRIKIESMEKKSCPQRDSYGAWDASICTEELVKADKIKELIPADLLEESVIKELVARHDTLKKMPEHMTQVYENKNAAFMESAGLVGDFSNTVHDISYWNQLEYGKANKAVDIGYVEGLKESLPRIKQLAADCKGKYAEIVQKSAERQAQCDLASNADKYYAQLAAASYKAHLQAEIKEINVVIGHLENPDHRFIEYSDYKRLVLDGKEYVSKLKQDISQSHKLAGLNAPSYAELDAAIAKVPEAIKAATSKNRWSDKKTVSVSDAIEERTAQVVKKNGLKLVNIGRVDEPWTLVKNGLGVPLYKSAEGWVLLKNPKESFCRMQHATFTRAYDGIEYAAASNINFISSILPTPCD